MVRTMKRPEDSLALVLFLAQRDCMVATDASVLVFDGGVIFDEAPTDREVYLFASVFIRDMSKCRC